MDLLPGEDLVYIGDTGRYPYGPRPQAEVRIFARELAWSLVKDFDAKAVIVACNTAAAAGLDDLAQDLPVPVFEVIQPGARALVEASTSGRVGVIGTVGTVSSGAYARAVDGDRRGGRADRGGLPWLRRVRGAGRDRRRAGHDPGRAAAGAAPGRGRRHAPARLHPLPLPGPGDRRRHGARRRAGQLGRRDRVRCPPGAGRPRPACGPAARRPASTASSRRATWPGSPISAVACSAPSSSTPAGGRRPST